MAELSVPPYAPALIESMRAVGYSLESAIADLIDNSISAGATSIQIQFRPYDEPYVAIVDNGHGMAPDELTEAMRHGGKNPLGTRQPHDLGRFGLGLKTASLSQCRKLTVISLKDGFPSARCWDLDLIAEREEWILKAPDSQSEIRTLPHVDEIVKHGKGTVVLWQGLDRLSAGEGSIENALGAKMDHVRDHLALVFHRYLTGEQGIERIRILLNNNPIQSIDPFLASHKATQVLYKDVFDVEGHDIKVQPYILPHISKLSLEELRLAGGEEGLRRNQGFYIYRNKRLIIRGTWFRLARAEELTKLARVMVDIPNTLDHLWTLDIKKSAANPPEIVRKNLGRTVERIADRSRQTYTFRGRTTRRDAIIHTWNRIQGRGGISYGINRDHPAILSLFEMMDDDQRVMFRRVLETIEMTFPADSLYADFASDKPRNTDPMTEDSLRDLAWRMLDSASSLPGGKTALLSNLHLVEPFCSHPEIANSIIGDLANAQ